MVDVCEDEDDVVWVGHSKATPILARQNRPYRSPEISVFRPTMDA